VEEWNLAVKKPEIASNSKKNKQSQDKFTIYAALLVLLAFAVIAFFIYHVRSTAPVETSPTYVELKQTIVNDSGTVARLAVTVQVGAGDEDWLKENQPALNAYFHKELSTTEVATFRTKEGLIELQDELKRKFNLLLKTDKIQAVMVTELLMQDQSNI
jgi:flagellar basal body-associated protein FliL